MSVTIATAAWAMIRADVAAAGANEACGLLLGQGDRVVAARACRNVADDPARRFEIDPAVLLAAHRAARGGGPGVLGHYHSHPNGSPYPSPRDAADAAADGALWLIVGAHEALLWRAVADGAVEGRFDPCAIRPGVPEAESNRSACP